MSRPCHLPAESWYAKPGMPVSTPQISWSRFLMASSVALLTSPAQPAPAAPAGMEDRQMEKIPATSFALVSGSASWGIRFPEDVEEPGFRVARRDIVFDTPWGPSHGWKLIDIDGSVTADGQPRQILNVFAHGWPPDRIDHEAHRRVAWVLQEAGVAK